MEELIDWISDTRQERLLNPKSGDYFYTRLAFIYGTRFWNFLLKLDPNKPSWTIPAQPGKWTGPFHWEDRRLRVPELAALQSFPSDFKFYGNRRSVQMQIGNAVPPIFSKVLSSTILEILGDDLWK